MTDDNTNMREVSHTNPNTGRPFGDAVAFRRGAVAADGGEPETEGEETDETMEDVSHTAPDSDNDSAQRTFERGTEGRDEGV